MMKKFGKVSAAGLSMMLCGTSLQATGFLTTQKVYRSYENIKSDMLSVAGEEKYEEFLRKGSKEKGIDEQTFEERYFLYLSTCDEREYSRALVHWVYSLINEDFYEYECNVIAVVTALIIGAYFAGHYRLLNKIFEFLDLLGENCNNYYNRYKEFINKNLESQE